MAKENNMDFLTMIDPKLTVVFGAAWAVSEALSLIPAVKSNGIFQLIYNGLKRISGR